MRNFSTYIFIILVIFLNSCSSSRKAARSSAPSVSATVLATEYLNKYSALAVSEMKRTGVPASITLAQGMLESNYGRSNLAVRGNNHFGIKCHNDWQGARVFHDDNRRGECFRAYPSAEESFRDHSDFLVNGSRYRELFSLSSTDYKGWAHGLKRAGYATDPNYAHLLIKKIDEYGLHDYDTGRKIPGETGIRAGETTGALAEPKTAASIPSTGTTTSPTANRASASSTVQTNAGTAAAPTNAGTATAPASVPGATTKVAGTAAARTVPSASQAAREEEAPIKVISLGTGKKIMENNNVEYIIVEEGDTYESLAVRYQLLSWEITRYNDLAPGTPLQPGQVIYLQPKRTKAAEGSAIHIVAPGETMYGISQKYAIKLSSLYKMNVMTEGSECKPGQKLRIR